MPADDFFVRHDLSHFAVETILGYKTAFYGMINNGVELSDFMVKERRDALKLTTEAMHAESLANLFLMDFVDGPVENFDQVQQQTMTTSFPNAEPVSLTGEQINSVRQTLSNLLFQWNQLPAGEFFQLEILL